MCLEHDLAFRSLAISSFARQTELMGSDAACADNFLLTECHLSLCHYISTSCAGRIQQVVSMLPRHVDYRDLAVINIQIHLKKKITRGFQSRAILPAQSYSSKRCGRQLRCQKMMVIAQSHVSELPAVDAYIQTNAQKFYPSILMLSLASDHARREPPYVITTTFQ